jgi:hypothetical protein
MEYIYKGWGRVPDDWLEALQVYKRVHSRPSPRELLGKLEPLPPVSACGAREWRARTRSLSPSHTHMHAMHSLLDTLARACAR